MRMKDRLDSDDDRGAVLIIVAVFAIVAIIFLAFVVDIGNQRQDRRQLTTATDAAALDVAQSWANNSLEPLSDFTLISADLYDCSTDAQDYLDRNRVVDAGDYSCEAEFKNDQLGSVTVFAKGTTDYQVGSAVGIKNGRIGSATAVRVSSTVGGGLRPFALCASQPAVLDWYNTKDGPNGSGYTAYEGAHAERITVAADKFLPEECGKNNGNWGFVQYESQGSGVGSGGDDGKLASTIENGTGDALSSYDGGDRADRCNDDYSDQQANYGEVTCIFDANGSGAWNNNNTADAFDTLIASGETFNLPIYDNVVDLGGSKTGFPIVAFAEVRLVSYVQGGAKDNSVTLDFVQISAGTCCNVTDGNRALEICDVGTTGGAVLATFPTNCQTFSGSTSSPPVVPPSAACEVTSINPATQSVNVDGSGNSQADATVDVTVADAADCGTVTLDAVAGGTTVPASSSSLTGDTYTFTFSSGTTFAPSGTTFTAEVYEGGTLRDDSASITTATAAPTCDAVVTPATQSVTVVNGTKGSKVTGADVTWTVTIATPACAALSLPRSRTVQPHAPLRCHRQSRVP